MASRSALGLFGRSRRRLQVVRAPTLAAVPISLSEELEELLEDSKVFVERLDVGQGGGAHNTTMESVMEQFNRLTADQLKSGIGAPDDVRGVQHGT